MNYPLDIKIHPEHTWIKVEGEIGIVGITEHAQNELGEIVYFDPPNTGNVYNQGDVFGSIEALKTVSDLFMPVSSSIVEINTNLKANPMLVNSDPFGEGWLIKVKIKDISDLEKLQSVEEYQLSIK
jgi:glycine cleavage system H protein